jgi:ribonuclease Z
METLVLGCGEAFDERLPNTSLLVDCGEVLLLDCGYSVPPQVWSASPDPGLIDAVYISHAHADHYFGLPALLTRMWEDNRTKPLMIVGQAGVLEQIPQQMELAYRGVAGRFRFPIEYRQAKPGEPMQVGRATLRFAETRHAAVNYAVRVESGGKAVCYSGDGAFTDASRKLFSGADLLFHEAYSFEESPTHGEIDQVIEMAGAEGVARLGLVHVKRTVRRESDRLIEAVHEGGKRVLLPEPGSRYTT